MKPLYNTVFFDDLIAIFAQLDEFSSGLGISRLEMDQQKVASIIAGMKHDFPHRDGVEQASIFKKVANFICYFVAEQPVVTSMPEGLGKLSSRKLNPVLAVDIGLNVLKGATIHKGNGDCIIRNVKISRHAYLDFLDVLGKGVTPEAHMHFVSLFLEQLVYKANPEIEYDDYIYE